MDIDFEKRKELESFLLDIDCALNDTWQIIKSQKWEEISAI
ncbi:hypothetical protein [Fusibacter tunisiensis]|uniref:Uncharacterized protein n=1 Tax=Fusibacter tunisiensis TaxID=1008308 RepID=A0ABS2MTZ6_9FIRM|nr:hypothetical protein [Fusibacter tunisiensis]MBM7562883.1 hypothetical protein [Fusibacter tunisiensis]